MDTPCGEGVAAGALREEDGVPGAGLRPFFSDPGGGGGGGGGGGPPFTPVHETHVMTLSG